jgi:hypothetical protein
VNLVRRAKFLDDRASNESGRARDEDPHRRGVYVRVFAFVGCALALAGCRHAAQHRTAPHLSYAALDAEQQRLVRVYQPVSRAMYGYEIAYRSWTSGQAPSGTAARAAARFRVVVARSLRRLRAAPAVGETADAKALLLEALRSRRRALDTLRADVADGRTTPSGDYVDRWDRSLVYARRGLTKLQDIRDHARLIPIPEDSIS